MSTTLGTLLTRLAYRLGEDSSPSDSNEKARRMSFFNEAQRKILGESYWWFLQTTASTTAVCQQEIYSLEDDFRDMIEVRVNGKVAMPISQPTAFNNYDYPPLSYEYESLITRWFVFGDNDLHIIPVPTSTPSAISVSSIVQTGGVATVTTSTDHGYKAGNYVTIAGANESGYNGAFRVNSVPSATTFTYSVDSSTSSPATGTITSTQRNIVYRYWQQHTDMTSDTDTVLIPDRFTDILVAYTIGRINSGPLNNERGSSADGFEEYNNILKDMIRENNRKKFMYKGFIPRSYQSTIL